MLIQCIGTIYKGQKHYYREKGKVTVRELWDNCIPVIKRVSGATETCGAWATDRSPSVSTAPSWLPFLRMPNQYKSETFIARNISK